MCAAASIGSYWLPGSRDHDEYIHIISYTVFFALGIYGRELITTIVTKHALAALVTALCLYKALDIVRHIEPRRAALAISDVPWMLSAAIALISASVLLCRVPRHRESTRGDRQEDTSDLRDACAARGRSLARTRMAGCRESTRRLDTRNRHHADSSHLADSFCAGNAIAVPSLV